MGIKLFPNENIVVEEHFVGTFDHDMLSSILILILIVSLLVFFKALFNYNYNFFINM